MTTENGTICELCGKPSETKFQVLGMDGPFPASPNLNVEFFHNPPGARARDATGRIVAETHFSVIEADLCSECASSATDQEIVNRLNEKRMGEVDNG